VGDSEEAIPLTHGSEQPSRSDIPPLVPLGRHYSRAPIVEAIIEVRCELAVDTTLEELAHAVDRTEFPTADQAVEILGQVNISEEGLKSETTGKQIGHVFRRKDDRRIVQSRLNGFAYSALPPYERWESFIAEAWRHWLDYERVSHAVQAVRLGVRYVNKIDIPQESIEIKDYLRTAIDVSPYLPQMMAGYFFQTVLPLQRFDATATITSTTAPPPSEDSTSLILDIDAWKEVAIPLGTSGADEAIREQLDILRQAKNYVFEACITDATRGLIG